MLPLNPGHQGAGAASRSTAQNALTAAPNARSSAVRRQLAPTIVDCIDVELLSACCGSRGIVEIVGQHHPAKPPDQVRAFRQRIRMGRGTPGIRLCINASNRIGVATGSHPPGGNTEGEWVLGMLVELIDPAA